MSPPPSRMRAWARSLDPLEVGLVLAGLAMLCSYSVVLLMRDDALDELGAAQESRQRVVVVTGEGSADGLVADSLGDVVLTLPGSRMPAALMTEVQRLNPTRVVVLGGHDAVSAAAAAELSASTTAPVTRLAGQDRYATAAKAALSTFAAPVREVLIATSGAEAAGTQRAGRRAEGIPVLLVTHDRVPGATTRALELLQPERLTVVGGRGAVSDAVWLQLQQHTSAG